MPAGLKRTPRLPAEVRRRDLLDAALDLVYEQGFAAVTIEAVARRAGVTRPVVYDQFGSLDALLVALLEREESSAVTPLLKLLDDAPRGGADPEQVLFDSIHAFLDSVRANPRTWRFILLPPSGTSIELRERIARSRRLVADRVEGVLDWGVARRGGPHGLDHALAARLIVAAGEDAARLTLLHPRRYPPDRIAALARELLMFLPATASPHGRLTARELELPEPDAPAPAPEDDKPSRMPRAQRREQLLDVTLGLLAENGWDQLNIDAIARRAGVNRTVVYRSFPNLKLLLFALFQREDSRTRRTIEALLPADTIGRTAQDMIAHALVTFLSAVLQNPQTYRVVLQRPESAPLFLQRAVNRRRALVAERLRPLVEWGLGTIEVPPSNLDVDLVARFLLSSGEELARLMLDDPDYPPERLLGSVLTLLELVP